MNDITFEDSGMEEFQDMLGSYLSKVDEKSALDAIEEGAKEFVNDLLRLPKPRRKVTAPATPIRCIFTSISSCGVRM